MLPEDVTYKMEDILRAINNEYIKARCFYYGKRRDAIFDALDGLCKQFGWEAIHYPGIFSEFYRPLPRKKNKPQDMVQTA